VGVSFNARLRRLVGIGGGRGSVTSSSLRNAAQLDVYGAVRRPGPFDVPPAEPVQLASPLPWELQDSDEGAIADWVNRYEARRAGRTGGEPLA
jgi:hypothetical protein